MEIKRTENTRRNIAVGTINKIITILLPFIVRTVMIRTVGSEYLGLNSLFSSILQVLNLAELGFSSAIVYNMYRPIAENDIKTLSALYAFFKKIYNWIGVIILVAGIIVTPFLPLLINGEQPKGINIYIVFWVYLFNTVATYAFGAYKCSIPNAMQRTDIVNVIGMISLGGMYVSQIVVLLLFSNYYIYIILMPAFTLLNNFLMSTIVDRAYPDIKCRGRISNEIMHDIKTRVSGLMITKICQTSRNSLDSIFVSTFLGLEITAIYNNYYYVINALMGFSTIILGAMAAGVGNSIIKESVSKNYNDMRRINFIYMWISGWATICLLCLYQPFMELWMGRSYLFPYSIVIIFAIYFYALKMGDVRGLYSDANGLWWENRYRAVAESVTNIILNIVLGQLFGVYGIIIATLISLLVVNFGFGSQIVFKYYFNNGKLHEYFIDHLKYALISMAVTLITILVCRLIKGNLLLVLLLRGIICCLLPNILYLIIYKKTYQYTETMPWFLEKIGMKKYFGFLIK